MNLTTALFCLLIFLNLIKQNVKRCFMIIILHSENLYTFQNTMLDILKTVAKFCEKVFKLNIGITHVFMHYHLPGPDEAV